MVGRFVRDERLRDALTFQSLYLGLSPYESMAIYSLLPYTEIAGGLYYPMGGVHRLSAALAQLAEELGAQVRYGARVSRIERSAGRATGVLLEDGTRVAADVVVSNADLPYTYASLLGEPYAGIDGMEFSCSVVLMYLGVSRRYPGLLHHNLVVPARMRAAAPDAGRPPLLCVRAEPHRSIRRAGRVRDSLRAGAGPESGPGPPDRLVHRRSPARSAHARTAGTVRAERAAAAHRDEAPLHSG
jgi:phytoene dehydrogenase-like protein